MKTVFDSVLKKKPSELEYLKLLLESDFPLLLAKKVASYSVNIPRLVQVNISYIDKSPRLSPQKPWSFNSGVEFGDIMFAIKYEYLQKDGKDKSIKIRKDEKRSRAFVFQSKKTETEYGESTRKQEFLYRNWPLFKVSVPHDIRDNCNNPSNLFEQPNSDGKCIKKSGLWIINTSTPPMPEVIIRDSAEESDDLRLSTDDFFKKFSDNKEEIGKKYSADDDWSKLVTAILGYTDKKKLRRASAINTYNKRIIVNFLQLLPQSYISKSGTFEEVNQVKSNCLSRFITKLFYLFSKPFWIVEITVTDAEFNS